MLIDVEPLIPAAGSVLFPWKSEEGDIVTLEESPSDWAAHTAGFVIDREALRMDIPFEMEHFGDEPNQDQANRYLEFSIIRNGDSWLMPRIAEDYRELISQFLGAIMHRGVPEGTTQMSFDVIKREFTNYAERSKYYMHPEGLGNFENDKGRFSLVSDYFPTYVGLEKPNRTKDKQRMINRDEFPVDSLWVPEPEEIIVLQGETPHSVPHIPQMPGVRTLSGVMFSDAPIDWYDFHMVIDDVYVPLSEVRRTN
jgi:hypothetical protein